ncbi:MAG: hypothetical protein M3N08_09405, partial [Pseudomonadota bacterium]|nr:hypothetical protein [Pseudomonadota bacterium]
FKGIAWLPDNALRWVTALVATDLGAPSAASSASLPPGAGPVTYVANTGMGPAPFAGTASVTASGITGAKGADGAAAAAAQSHSMKMALFPTYREEAATSPAATSAPGSMSSNASTPQPSNIHVSVSTSSLSGGGSRSVAANNTPNKTEKTSREQHESSMGGKDRTGGDGDKGSGG